MNVTPQMLNLLHHTLGLRPDRRESFRNHFLAGPGHHDQPDLEALESAGLMRRVKTPAFCDRDDVTFVCTPAGKDYAIDNLPAPPPEPKRNNYRDFIEADAGYSFSEWLGINKPVYEVRGRSITHHQVHSDLEGACKVKIERSKPKPALIDQTQCRNTGTTL